MKNKIIKISATIILFSILTVGFGTGCDYSAGKYEFLAKICGVKKYQAAKDVSYGTNTRHKLDLYSNGNGTAKPVVVFVHGGSWKRGDKSQYAFAGRKLAKSEAIVIIPNYRLFPEVKFPFFVDDVAEVVAWTQANVSKYGGDPNKIILAGHSAGAEIAALVAYDPQYLKKANVNGSAIVGFIGFAGPYDFIPIIDADVFEGIPRHEFNVVDRLTKDQLPPALLLHGRSDTVVQISNSESLKAKIQELGGSAMLKEYSLLKPHVAILAPLSRSFTWLTPGSGIVEFIRDN